jgi:hypothetical protein
MKLSDCQSAERRLASVREHALDKIASWCDWVYYFMTERLSRRFNLFSSPKAFCNDAYRMQRTHLRRSPLCFDSFMTSPGTYAASDGALDRRADDLINYGQHYGIVLSIGVPWHTMDCGTRCFLHHTRSLACLLAHHQIFTLPIIFN